METNDIREKSEIETECKQAWASNMNGILRENYITEHYKMVN